MKLIVGLGNPGKKYEGTRHNIGFRVVDRLCEALEAKFKKARLREEAVVNMAGAVKVILAKPLTFMNLSGEAVGEVLRYYRLDPEGMLVVHDDLDLPLGRLKFSKGSSAGGHNGVASIINSIDTRKFGRLRIGIGRPSETEGKDVVAYVLEPFPPDERKFVEETIVKSGEALRDYLKSGIEAVMNRYNKK
ncbi:MAG: aminoacyl-tRNA hydrolase [Deltaproteobacteria bacterium]|nr:aminoacyl-tRNA hydrolase [Deltaproteobacteria bacterium]